jgi:hypothetical protein
VIQCIDDENLRYLNFLVCDPSYTFWPPEWNGFPTCFSLKVFLQNPLKLIKIALSLTRLLHCLKSSQTQSASNWRHVKYVTRTKVSLTTLPPHTCNALHILRDINKGVCFCSQRHQ